MLDHPSSRAFARLTGSLAEIAPAATIGFAQRIEQGRVAVSYANAGGTGEFVFAAADVPAILQPGSDGPRDGEVSSSAVDSLHAIEWTLLLRGVRRLVSAAVRDGDGSTRLWIGLPAAAPLSSEQLMRMAAVAADSGAVLRVLTAPLNQLAERLAEEERSNRELRAQATNLELLDELLATLIDSGELPDVFGRISTMAAKVLSHDAVALMVRIGDGRTARMYASSGFVGALPATRDIPQEMLDNPAWESDIFDELPADGTRFAAAVSMGYRSALRVRIRLDGQFAGALLFFSTAASAFKPRDVLVASRIADRVAVTLARDREIVASRRADEATARAARLEARVRELTDELDARTGYRRVVGESPRWREVLKQATQVAATDATVLLLGESGTGKEVVARFVHRGSARSGGPFIALNCAALPEQLLEAELFGYERGAYTGATQSKPGQLEQAAGGTLFLDEVGEMSLPAQAKFLRVLQEKEFQRLGGTRVLRTDARIVAATNRDLARAIVNGQFREDLYYRLNVFALPLPPLRERRDDILPLSEAFLAEIARGLGRPPAGISRDARQALIAHSWPGNVRELRNMLERAAILCEGGLITSDYFAFTVPRTQPLPSPVPVTTLLTSDVSTLPAPTTPPTDLESMERTMIEQALHKARFNKSKAAKALGLSRQQLYVRMRKYDLE